MTEATEYQPHPQAEKSTNVEPVWAEISDRFAEQDRALLKMSAAKQENETDEQYLDRVIGFTDRAMALLAGSPDDLTTYWPGKAVVDRLRSVLDQPDIQPHLPKLSEDGDPEAEARVKEELGGVFDWAIGVRLQRDARILSKDLVQRGGLANTTTALRVLLASHAMHGKPLAEQQAIAGNLVGEAMTRIDAISGRR